MEIKGPTSDSSSDGVIFGFGKKIYFEDMGDGISAKSSGGSSSVVDSKSVSVMGKRGRGVSHSPRCQVEGCDLDLSGAKAYYARHKVCGMHSKSPVVVVAGVEQRFCQQCSRFHRLPEFDQDKRSCRRRLAGHNERRRKPPPESPFFLRYKRLFSSLQEERSRMGSSPFDFTAYSVLPGGNSLPFIRSGDCTPGNQPIPTGSSESPSFFSHPSQPYLQSSTGGMALSSSEIPSGEEYFSGVSDSSRALSLLSFQPWDPSNRGSGLTLKNQMASGVAPMAQLAGPHCLATGSNNFATDAWHYKANESDSSSNKLLSNSDLAQAPQAINAHLSSQGEVAHEGSKQHMGHWCSQANEFSSYWTL